MTTGDDWRVHGNLTPNPGDVAVTYIVDNIWDCKEKYDIEITAKGDGKKYSTKPGVARIQVENPPCPITSGLQADPPDQMARGRLSAPNPYNAATHAQGEPLHGVHAGDTQGS